MIVRTIVAFVLPLAMLVACRSDRPAADTTARPATTAPTAPPAATVRAVSSTSSARCWRVHTGPGLPRRLPVRKHGPIRTVVAAAGRSVDRRGPAAATARLPVLRRGAHRAGRQLMQLTWQARAGFVYDRTRSISKTPSRTAARVGADRRRHPADHERRLGRAALHRSPSRSSKRGGCVSATGRHPSCS